MTQQAAYRLLSFEGGQAAITLRGRIADNIFPTYPHIEQHKQDPCTSGFAWRLRDCYKCLGRNDLRMEWVARQINPYCVDPSLPVPDHLKSQFSHLTKDIDTSSMWIVMGPTMDDHKFEMYESVLMAYTPNAAAELVHSILAEINTRQGMSRRQLSIHLEQHYIILTAEERERVYQLWNEMVSRTETWGETEETTEMFLFKVVLKNLTGDNQLYALLKRPEQAPDLIVYSNSFSHVENWDAIRNQLISSINTKRLSRLLWFISSFPKEVPLDILTTSITKLMSHEESIIRFHALEIAYRTENATLIAEALSSAWKWSPSHCDLENHWGSLLLCKFGKNMPFTEVCIRVHPAYLGHAVFFRGNQETEVELYAQSIHQFWLGLEARTPDLPLDVPNFTVNSTEANDVEHMSRLGLDKDSLARSITWISPHATWGGTDSDEPDFNLTNEAAYIERQKTLLAILRDAVEQQKVAGNFLFGHDFFLEELDNIIERYSSLVDEWVQAVLNDSVQARRRLRLSSAFYTALCISLFKEKDAGKAISLYWRLKDTGMGVRVIDYYMKMELVDLALFGGLPTDRLRSAWTSKLEQAKSDHGLLQVAVYAQYGTAADWLWSYIMEGIHSAAPVTKARAIVLSGFLDDQKALDALEKVLHSSSDTWIAVLAEVSKDRWNRNMWAKHWYRQFLVSEDNVVSWASFRLFLKSVDTRFWLWHKDLETEVAQTYSDTQRQLFLRDSLDDIGSAIEKNEKQMVENFLGQKILNGEVWPWM